MFPYKDDNPAELTPVITVALIGVNVAAFVLLEGMGLSAAHLRSAVCEFGMIPSELTGQSPSGPAVCPPGGLRWVTALTSMFIHGGWFHLISNMLFLWVFGNNVEDSMGHLRFLVFYLLVGVVGAAGHVLLNAGSGVPTVGASGAISGVLGAYMVLYPRVSVHVLFFPFWILRLPAFLVLGYWIALQLFMGFAQLGGGFGGGVAVWAHIGGFFAGIVLVRFFERETLVRAKREGRRLGRGEISGGGGWW